MLKLKEKKLIWIILLFLLGMGYFSAFSSLDISIFLKGYIAIIPMQILALIYVIYLRWNHREVRF